MSRAEQYYLTFKLFIMIWYIVGLVVVFLIGYLIGSNNPLPSVKRKIIQKAQDSLAKIKQS